MALNNEQKTYLAEVIGDLRFLERYGTHEVSEDELRNVSGKLRHLMENRSARLQRAWSLSGLGGLGQITALKLRPSTSLLGFGYAGGAIDKTQNRNASTEILPMETRVITGNGESGASALSGLDWIHLGTNDEPAVDTTMNPELDPFVEHQFSFGDYPKSYILFSNRQKVAREQVVKYIANIRNGVHDGNLERAAKGDASAFRLLNAVSKRTVFGRGAEYYSFLSIVQNLVNAPDIVRLIQASNLLTKDLERRR